LAAYDFSKSREKAEGGKVSGRSPLRRTKTVIAPTLSELIEACPKVIDGHSFHLTWTSVLGKGDKWVAYYDDGGASIGIEGYGDVSDEAVANLWLELNRKV
jgi:hypothetical protein